MRRRAGRWLSGLFLSVIPILIGVLLAWVLTGSAPVERLRHLVFDQYQRWKPREWHAQLPVRVIDIDDASLARVGQWPWPRAKIAELTRKLAANGAAAIAFDILFAEEERFSPGALLSQLPKSPERDALQARLKKDGLIGKDPLREAFKAAPVVAAVVLGHGDLPKGAKMKTNFVLAGDNPAPALARFSGMILPLPSLTNEAAGLGAMQYLPDQDLIVRRVPLVFGAGLGDKPLLVPGLAAESLRVALRTRTPIIKSTNASGELNFGNATSVVAMKIGPFEIPVEHDGSLRVHFSGTQKGRTVPAWQVMDGSVKKDEIAGRIVLIGSSAASLIDLRSTPLETRVAGVDVHAEVIEHIVSGAKLARPDWAPGAEAFAIIIGGLLITFLVRRFRPLPSAIAALTVIAAGAAGSWFAFSRAELLLDPLIPGVTWLATWMTATVGIFRQTEAEKRFVRGAFSRYLSPAVVERIADDPGQLALGGETREVTILFSDVRDFTTRSEQLDAEGVVQFLNALHTPFTGAVLAEQGTIDKYIGDGLMAFWNAPLDVDGHANKACSAALRMLALVPEIDAAMAREAQAQGRTHQPLRIGIGINTGLVFVGNMGSDQRFDYSIVGDAVNVTARLETATKEFALPVLVSESTMRAADRFRFLDLGATGLKGKTGETAVYALHGPKDADGEAFPDFEVLHNQVTSAARIADTGTMGTQLAGAVASAKAHPLGARYAAFYDRLLSGALALN